MKNKKIIILIAIVVFVIGLAYALAPSHCLHCVDFSSLNPQYIRDKIQAFGSLAIVIYILLYTLNSFSPFFPPIAIMSLTAGAAFGPIWGTIALTLGTMVGTSSVFFVARYLGGDWVQKMVKGKGEELYHKLSDNGFKFLMPLRLIGFPPYGIIDAICGVSKMRFLDFFLATFVGGVPWILTQVLLADRIANFNPKDPVLWSALIAFILMIVITNNVVNKKKNEKGIPDA